MKKVVSYFVLFMLLFLCSCGKQLPKTPSSEKIVNDLNETGAVGYPFKVESVDILRSQLQEEQKQFLADIVFSGKNEYAAYTCSARVYYDLYDQGWIMGPVYYSDTEYTVVGFQTEEDMVQSVVSSEGLSFYADNIRVLNYYNEGESEFLILEYEYAPVGITCIEQALFQLDYDGFGWTYQRIYTEITDCFWQELVGDYYSKIDGQLWFSVTSANAGAMTIEYKGREYTLYQDGEMYPATLSTNDLTSDSYCFLISYDAINPEYVCAGSWDTASYNDTAAFIHWVTFRWSDYKLQASMYACYPTPYSKDYTIGRSTLAVKADW